MLTREGFVVADMSGPNTLQRSSWKAEAIRRGDLKISGPIPIKEDTPLNEVEEREFAETGTLSPVPVQQDQVDSHQDAQRPQTPPQPEFPPQNRLMRPMSLTSHPVEGSDYQRDGYQDRQPSRSPPRVQHIPETTRESVAQPMPQTPSTPFRSTPESASKAAQKKKRKSGLRNVFRKMFGRKSRDDEEDEPPHRGHSYHHSDPGLLRQSPPRENVTPNGPRISELPVEELQPPHPLTQHLPFPMNVNAPQATPPDEYLHFDMQRPDISRRRATLPTVPSIGIQRHSLDDVRGRLSTWEEGHDDDATSSPGIGIALSSPTQAITPIAQKRRSRSVDAMRDLARDGVSMDRRRSAEIRYWRQSYASGSIYSRPQTAKTVETMRSVQQQGANITEPENEAVEMSATLAHVDEPSPLPDDLKHESHVREIEPPVSAFNFGLKSGFSDDTGPSEAQLSAPSPAHEQPSPNRLSIEERVAHLEGNFQSLELSMRRMSSRNNRQTIILSDAPRNLRSRTRNSSSRSSTGSDNAPAYQSSNDTLNPGPTSPVLMRPSAAEDDTSRQNVIEKLYEALKYERSARKTLEQQVQSLQHDISDLHALVNKLIASATATSPSYPTPSPDAVVLTSTEDRLITPRPSHTKNYPLDENKENDIRESVISKFSRTDSSRSNSGRFDHKTGDWKPNESSDDVASPEVWATPKEEEFVESKAGFFAQVR